MPLVDGRLVYCPICVAAGEPPKPSMRRDSGRGLTL